MRSNYTDYEIALATSRILALAEAKHYELVIDKDYNRVIIEDKLYYPFGWFLNDYLYSKMF